MSANLKSYAFYFLFVYSGVHPILGPTVTRGRGLPNKK